MKSNNFKFNPLRYEEHLSPFGQKVLKTLIQKWKCDEYNQKRVENDYRQRFAPSMPQNRRILTFRDEASYRQCPPMICKEINTENNTRTDKRLNFNLVGQHLPQVPTTTELVETLDTTHKTINEDSTSVSITNDLINSVIIGHENAHDFPDSVLGMDFMNKPVNIDKTDTNITKGVDWNSMFDTELISELVLKEVEAPEQTAFDIDLNDTKTKRNKVKNTTKALDTEKSKRKYQQITEVIPKKVKKTCDKTQINFRKQNYTKTVKNWLNEVDPNNPVGDEISHIDAEPNKMTDRAEITIEKVKGQPNKKVVQSELANKDGKMKFRKPKTKNVDKQEVSKADDSLATNENAVEAINVNPLKNKTEKDSNKEKKSKSKFVAPIKSQIPVRDVEFKVITLDGHKIENHAESLNHVKKRDLAVILVYSNGFCQLNNHHTEDTSDPEGVMLSIDENFYYLKGRHQNIKVLLQSLLENNKVLCYEGKSLLIYVKCIFDLDIHNVEMIDAKVLIETKPLCPERSMMVNDDYFHLRSWSMDLSGLLCPLQSMIFTINNSLHVHKYYVATCVFVKKYTDILPYFAVRGKIGGSLLDPDSPPDNFSELQKLLSFTPQYTIATECTLQKAAWYTALLKECCVKLTSLLMEEQLWNVFVEIEMKLLPIIAEMERSGVSVDLQKLKSMEDILLTKMKSAELECHKAAGKSFHINSTVQVRALIYDELQLDTKCNVKIRETLTIGAKSTSESMLRSLVSVHPLPKLILEYRHLHKAHATFLTGIAQHVKHGIVRPTWVQTAAATGRIASNNPNLQAIPKAPFCLVMYPDDNNIDNQVLSFRSVYTGRVGYTLLAADFKHIECRVFAHAAADTGLLQALRSGQDLFRVLAAKWLKKPEGEISSEDRERTKRIVYASLYGAGCRKLMDILDVTYEQALSVIAGFNRTFPSLKSFGRSVVSRCEQNNGRLSTLCGRARRFKNIASNEFALKAQAERQAVNFVVQGSAADLCKMAMVMTSSRLRKHSPPVDGSLLLQIHDELVWEIRDEHLDTAAVIIKQVMESCGHHCGMSTTLPVAISTGKNWGEMTEYTMDKQ